MIDALMYGMIPRAKIDKGPQAAAREHVEHAQQRTLLLLEPLRHDGGVDARRRDVDPDAVHEEHQRVKRIRFWSSGTLPIFSNP